MQIPAHEDVEKLVRSAQLDIAADHHRIPSLDDGVLNLVEADFLVPGDAVFEVFTLQHLLHGHPGIETDDLRKGHLIEPIPVEHHFGPLPVQDFESLRGVGFGIGQNLFPRELRPCFGTAAGVANLGGEVTDNEHGVVAQLLELAEFLQGEGVTQMKIG